MGKQPSSSWLYQEKVLVATAIGGIDVLFVHFEAFESVSKSLDVVPIELRLDPDCFNVADTNGQLTMVRWFRNNS